MKTTNLLFATLLFIINITTISCSCQKEVNKTKMEKPNHSSQNAKRVITVPIVAKSFVNKVGEASEFKELYVQLSVQDYYIKFCESTVTRKELETQLANNDDLIKTVTIEVAFKNGNWDICDKNEEQQSRIGDYIIIHKIID